jgi:polyisoprenoid-binding protein YceI
MKIVTRLAIALVALAAATAVASAAATRYTIDKDHTEVGFDVRHIFSRVHGRFNAFSGTIAYDDKVPANIAVDATADAKSVWTDNDRRDAHLRSADFFAADSFPTLSFKSTRVTSVGPNKYKVAGDLTMRGVTKPVVFDGEFLGAGDVNIGGHSMGAKAGFAATTVVNRKDFGISWNKLMDSGGLMLSDEVTITLNIEGNQAPAATK